MEKALINPAIEVENLGVTFDGFNALKDVSFSIEKGEIAIVIGPNGAGKTTLIKAILGLLDFEGSVRILGKKPNEMAKADWAKIGYVPQKFDIPKNFPVTVKELLDYSLNTSNYTTDTRKRRLAEFIKLEHIEKLQNKIIGDISGGELQRVLIARALMFLPDIVFLDEPLAGIDVVGEKTFYEFISFIRTEYKITFMLVSHDVTVVSRLADKVLGINKKLLFFGKPEEVLSEDRLKDVYGSNIGIFKHSHCPEEGPCDLYKEQDIKNGS